MRRTSENGIGSEVGLVGRAIDLEHGVIDRSLIRRIHTEDGILEDGVDVLDGLEDALAHVATATVAEFVRLVNAGGGARRHRGREGALGGGDVDFDGGVACSRSMGE